MTEESECYSHSWNVLSRESVGGVADEEACFTHSAKSDKKQHSRWDRSQNDTLDQVDEGVY